MKNIFKLNLAFIGFPIVLCSFGLIIEGMLVIGLLSTVLTGIFQVVFGINMLIDEPKDINLRIYIVLVLLFFILWYIMNALYSEYLIFLLFAMPSLLAIYFSIILYRKTKDCEGSKKPN